MTTIVKGMSPAEFITAMNNNFAELKETWRVPSDFFYTWTSSNTIPANLNENIGADYLTYGENPVSKLNSLFSGTYNPHVDDEPITFTFNKRGNGTGVTTIRIKPWYSIYLSLSGNGRFYDNPEGTTNEGITRVIRSGTETLGDYDTLYFKCTDGTTVLTIQDQKRVRNLGGDSWSAYSVGDGGALFIENYDVNSPIQSGDFDFSGLVNIEQFYDLGSERTGDITGLTKLKSIRLYPCHGTTGDITGLTKLKHIYIEADPTCTMYGDITNLHDLEFIDISGSSSPVGQTITGDITNLTKLWWVDMRSYSSLYGDISGLVDMFYFHVAPNANIVGKHFSGSLAGLTKCQYFLSVYCTINEYVGGKTWPNDMRVIYLKQIDGYGLSSSEVDNLLIDLAAAGGTWWSFKTIDLPSPNAPRTSASNSAVATLQGKGVTVTTA